MQLVTDFHYTNTMGGGDVNVAYEGTFGDLSAYGDADLFNFGDIDGDELFTTHGAADSVPAPSGFTAVNGGNANGVTVSPKDVFNTDSVPPSTSFTNLTTPGSTYLETPNDDYQTSPLFGDNGDNAGMDKYPGVDKWFSLFPDGDNSTLAGFNTPAPMMARNLSSSSANQITVHPGGESMHRKRSSTTESPAAFSPAIKHSTVAGVNARKRDKPLPPIVVDETDAVALKRARNTAAARKSRAKKMEERDEFLAKISELEADKADLAAQVDFWKTKYMNGSASQDDDE